MKISKTLKKDFYTLVIKIVLFTFISTLVTYILLFVFISISNNTKEANYYENYLNSIEKDINKNTNDILKGCLIDLSKYDKNFNGEVIDINGNHLYGQEQIANSKINILKSINTDIVMDNYIYRYIPLVQDNTIKALYVIKAPFGYIINNYSSNTLAVIMYIVALASPIIYFILYLFIFTSKLYKNMLKNINILLKGSEKISTGNFNFSIVGVQGREFSEIQHSFNIMIKALKNNMNNLSKLDEERRMMVSSIAHDIRTPITVIKGQLEIIDELKEIPNFNMNDNLYIINKNCDRMTILTDNLSLLYKVENNSFLFRKNNVNLNKLLKEKELEIRTLCNKKPISINLQVKLKKEEYILDEAMLVRVLNNILYNSLRFTKEGEIKLIVYDDKNTNNIYFKCIDTGTGFKQKDTSKLFKAFYQDENYKNHFGLGLYISKKIINNYGGTIHAYNSKVKGAIIEFYIKEL